METITTSIRLDPNLLTAYDDLARILGRSRNYLLTEALREYLGKERAHQERLDRSIAQADNGEFADEEELEAWKADILARSGITPEERAALENEAARELRQAYGLPACE